MRSLLTRNEVKGQQKVRKASFADSECGEKSAAKANYDFADLKWDKKSAKHKCRCIC